VLVKYVAVFVNPKQAHLTIEKRPTWPISSEP
jgi:hypothetical protein